VEIWSDEATARCPSCGKLVIRTDTQSCIDWCRYARECLGDEGYREYGDMKAAIRQAALLRAVEDAFGEISPEAGFGRTVARFAQELCSQEKRADPMVVMGAAVLLCLARHTPAAVMAVLRELHYEDRAQAAVLAIHSALLRPDADAGHPEGIDCGLVHDAELLADQEQRHAAGQPVSPRELLPKCLTDRGMAMAAEVCRALRAPNSGENHG